MGRRIFLVVAGWLCLLGPAPAAPPACGGTDLIARLRQDNRPAYDALTEKAARIDNAEGLLWRIEKTGTRPSHLFGTAHVTDARVLAGLQRLQPILDEARVLAVEIVQSDLKAAGGRMLSRAIDASSRTLSSIEDAGSRQGLKGAIAELGLPEEAAEHIRPWFLAVMLSAPSCERARLAGGLPTVEARLEEMAAARRVRVQGLETPEEQIEALVSLPEAAGRRALVDVARLGAYREDMLETLIGAYLDGSVSRFLTAAQDGLLIGGVGLAGWAEAQDILVTRRNRLMTTRAIPLIETGGALVAVGALHLPGPTGLVQLLRAAGYTVTRVP